MDPSAPVQYTTSADWREFLVTEVDASTEKLPRRRYHRYPFDAYITVFGEADGEYFRSMWTLIQVSREGIMGIARKTVPLDANVIIELNWKEETYIIRGITRHCTQTLGGYKVGVKLVFSDE